MSSGIRLLAVAAVALIAAAAVLVYVLSYLRFSQSGQENVVVLNVTGVTFYYESPEWHCLTHLNESKLVRECWGEKTLYSFTLSNGTTRTIESMHLKHPPDVVDRVVEVMDFDKMVVYEYEELTPIKYKYIETGMENYVLRRAIGPTPLELRWVTPFSPHSDISGAVVFDGSRVLMPVAVFVYDDVNRSLFPAPRDVTGFVVDLLDRFYAEPIEGLVGVPVEVVSVDPHKNCSWVGYNLSVDDDQNSDLIDPTKISGAIRCGHGIFKVVLVRGGRLLRVDPVVGAAYGAAVPSAYTALSLAWRPSDSIGVGNMYNIDGIPHEFGHLLGFGDVYTADKSYWDEVSRFLNRGSIMDNPVKVYLEGYGETLINKLTLVDTASLLSVVWRSIAFVDAGLADRVAERLLGYGFNAADGSILLPTTPDGDIAEPFKSLAWMGVAYIRLDDYQITINTDLLNAMHRLAQAAQNTQQTETPTGQ